LLVITKILATEETKKCTLNALITNHGIAHSCNGKIYKLIKKEEEMYMFFNDDIKAAHPFYKDKMNNFTHCQAFAVHGNI